ncbi:MAG: hypothetical protein J7457_13690, partial [Roseiflexus sp.]|nr:hypothetical protein [Roseiflexus sp.]
ARQFIVANPSCFTIARQSHSNSARSGERSLHAAGYTRTGNGITHRRNTDNPAVANRSGASDRCAGADATTVAGGDHACRR